MVNMNGGKALMKALEKEGVKEVFGLPGGANLPMYDELYKSNIRHILVRHEQSAAHMADGFGRVSRKPGVCFGTSGPGATNLLTGIATAQADSAPMIAVTGQVPVKMIGRDAFQESDIIGMSKFRSSRCARSASRNWDWKNRLQREGYNFLNIA